MAKTNVLVQTLFIFLWILEITMAIRCYDGSAFHLGDSFVNDALLRPATGLRFTNWNYIVIKENCSACSTVVFTQEPKQDDRTPTVLVHLICEQRSTSNRNRLCSVCYIISLSIFFSKLIF